MKKKSGASRKHNASSHRLEKRSDVMPSQQDAARDPAPRGATGRNEQEPSAKSAQHEHVDRNERGHSEEAGNYDPAALNLNSLEEEEELARGRKGLSYSETDEDENEGLGDGNIGRSTPQRGFDEEG